MTLSSGLRGVLLAVLLVVSLAGCGDSGVDPDKLDVGSYSTEVRKQENLQPLPTDGTVLEGIRMSDAVADTSQFDSPLVYLWQADPVPDPASLTPVLGEAGRGVLEQNGFVAGYRAAYADRPQLDDGSTPPEYVGLAILLLRFRDDAAAQAAAAGLEVSNWKDFEQTVAAPLPEHPEVVARYTPGTGALVADTAIGPFVLHLMIEATPDGIERRVGDLDPVVDIERELIKNFQPTPIADLPKLPRDPDGLLAKMVATDPERWPPPSGAFAVYGAVGALRGQTAGMRRDKLFEKWGVEHLAVSGNQQLYVARDHDSAVAMQEEFTAELAGLGSQVDSDGQIPDQRCFKVEKAAPDAPGFACQFVYENMYTIVRANTSSSVKQMAAAQYALFANG